MRFILNQKLELAPQKESADGLKLTMKSGKFPIAKYTQIGYYLATPLVIGVFFGLLIDKYLGTKPVGFFVLLILGICSTFYNLGKIITDSSRYR